LTFPHNSLPSPQIKTPMDKVVIKKFPIKNKDTQELDIDTDKIKEEIVAAYPNFIYEHYTYTIQGDNLLLLFVLREKKNTGTIGFARR
jgi:hypothetical protein